MLINLSGLSFHAHSPSLLELMSVRRDVDPGARVFVAFNGKRWMIDYRSRQACIQRPFKSRDAAVQMIADRAA